MVIVLLLHIEKLDLSFKHKYMDASIMVQLQNEHYTLDCFFSVFLY